MFMQTSLFNYVLFVCSNDFCSNKACCMVLGGFSWFRDSKKYFLHWIFTSELSTAVLSYKLTKSM